MAFLPHSRVSYRQVMASTVTKTTSQPKASQPSIGWLVVVQDQLGWFHRGRAEVDHADEHGATARDQGPEAGPDPAGPVQHQAGDDDRVDDQADGEGVDLVGDRPANRVLRIRWSRWWPSDNANASQVNRYRSCRASVPPQM